MLQSNKMKLHLRLSSRTLILIFSLSLLVILAVIAWVEFPRLQEGGLPWSVDIPTRVAAIQIDPVASASEVSGTPTPIPPTPTPTISPTFLNLATGSPQELLNQQGLMIVSMRDGLYSHLFAYHPLYLPLTRLTNNPWDDITPALSPDGKRIAYASRQNGYWDLYMLDLTTGQQIRVTDTPDYEASPTWSPDGQWLAYERFDGLSQDIYILALDGKSSEPIRLTDTGVNLSPAWSPHGRQIAFVSDRTGDEEIWLADLDKVDNRFTNISQDPQSRDHYPAWSTNGSKLAWAAEKDGNYRLTIWTPDAATGPVTTNIVGNRPIWSPDGGLLVSVVEGPNQHSLAIYQAFNGHIDLPLTSLPGEVYGMTWVRGALPEWLFKLVQNGDQATSPALYQAASGVSSIRPAGRMSVLPLEDVTAPVSRLHEAVITPFNDLRKQVGIETGWDALSGLENAFVPVTTPNDPSLEDDWSYTGRAFSLNPLLLSAGWMTIVQENYEGKTYWRVFLKARYQDGSMGKPLPEMVWDLNARYSGSPAIYERGGNLASAPAGYWIDLTELASCYGWERQPSLTDWRTYYPSIRYNQFVMTGGLDWHAAMREIYPPEALETTTPQPTNSPTTSLTPKTPFPTITVTTTVTQVPVRRPTWTPMPTLVP